MPYMLILKQKWETSREYFEPGEYEVPKQVPDKTAQRMMNAGIATKGMPIIEKKVEKPPETKQPTATTEQSTVTTESESTSESSAPPVKKRGRPRKTTDELSKSE